MTLPVTSAPGKLVLAGEYALLEGHPGVVVAVDRRVRFGLIDEGIDAYDVPEVEAALEHAGIDDDALRVDARALRRGEDKLGLGSSAAATVAAVASIAARSSSIDDAATRRRIFDDALAAHERVQQGGSGVDIAASTYGGVLRFQRDTTGVRIEPLVWPKGLFLTAAFTGTPVRTADMIARVQSLRDLDAVAWARHMRSIGDLAERLVRAIASASAHECIEVLDHAGSAVESLGVASGVPIVPRPVRFLRDAVRPDGMAVKTSGAGGGDMIVAFMPEAGALREFEKACKRTGLEPLGLAVDPRGVAVEASRA